jgi:UPF0755 protein
MAVLVVGSFVMYDQFFSAPKVEAGQAVVVNVPEGSSTATIAKILKNGDVIADEQTFIKEAVSRNADVKFKPGNYQLATLMDTNVLITTLVAGPTPTGGKLTIPEGLTVEQTAKLVRDACGINEQDFLKLAYSASTYVADYPFLEGVYNNSVEGFLYPKTYMVPKGSNADYVIRMLLDQFAIETSKLDMTYATEHNLTLFDVITIASMIERETLAESERVLVSSVIYNRLHEGMRLQICASVVYILGDSYDGHPLLEADLEVESPYNTYKVDGLPAGPICSPRVASIVAAANPAQTDYLYYVLASTDGFHAFCATYDEFEAAKQEYEELFGIS